MKSITLLSPAKINLTLEVLGKKSHGYHEIRSIVQPVNLFDEVKIEIEDGEGIEIEPAGLKIPRGNENPAWRAARVFLRESGLNFKVRISMKKKIPLGSGLGGGSSNAAAVLVGMNRITKKFSEDELTRLSPNIGADVALFIHCRSAIVEGIGEKIALIRNFPLFYYVLLNPGFEVSTRRIYEFWDTCEPQTSSSSVEASNDEIPEQESLKINSIENTISLFRKGEFPLRNDLERVTTSLHPEIKTLKEKLLSMEVGAVSMTGSGPTIFGVFRDKKRAKRVYDYLRDSSTFRVFFAQGISGWHRLST